MAIITAKTRCAFSLAGVQLKFSAVMEASAAGLPFPASGVGGSWIVKLPSRGILGVLKNEFPHGLKLASLIGNGNVPALIWSV